MCKVKQDGGILYHVNILHALVSGLIEIETEIYKGISKSGEKTMLVENFFKETVVVNLFVFYGSLSRPSAVQISCSNL